MTPKASPTRQRAANGRFASAPGAKPAPVAEAPAAVADPVPEAAATAKPLELYLLRHADAGDSSLWTGVAAERPLSKKGRRQAKNLARLLKDLGLRVDAVITSPLVRAAQTAKPVAKATGVDAVTDERLGYDFGKGELGAIVKELPLDVQRVVLVGHDPGFTDVASLLAGTHIPMAKGALARFDLADRKVRAGAGDLRWLLPPDAVAR